MNILIINHKEKQCGVYQYGYRVGGILKNSTLYNFIYLELESHDELDSYILEYNPKFIIYNWTGGTMPWVTPDTVQVLREKGIFQFLVVHNQWNYSQFFDGYLHQHPYWKETESRDFSIPRPLPLFKVPEYTKSSDLIKIGSFGFSLVNKYFNEVCRVVNEQFDKENVELRLHLTHGTFAGSNQNIDYIKNSCYENITRSNINLTITTEFMDDELLLEFLSSNDLNIFFYQDYSDYNGISSVIDYALAVKRPIAINKSSMYSHILDATPSICVEDNHLKGIISNGFFPLEEKYESWTNEKFIDKIESIIKTLS